ncbi:hypothetical protein [Acinetobacter proteolyticus]|uniref:hypothetical protein n=1 Tax=Acinetobacter proteolyticus TaxID=1776741 RepID=UPI003D98B198
MIANKKLLLSSFFPIKFYNLILKYKRVFKLSGIKEILENLSFINKQFKGDIGLNITKIENAVIDQHIMIVKDALARAEASISNHINNEEFQKYELENFQLNFGSPTISIYSSYERIVKNNNSIAGFSKINGDYFNKIDLTLHLPFKNCFRNRITLKVNYDLFDKFKKLKEIYIEEIKNIPQYKHAHYSSKSGDLNDEWVNTTANYIISLNKILIFKKVETLTIEDSNQQVISLYLNQTIGEDLLKNLLLYNGIRV